MARDAFEAHLGIWADSVVGSRPPAPEPPEPAVALDGQTLRGAKTPGAPGAHLLSALAHQGGVPLPQHAVDDQTNEITAGETVLAQLVLAGRMVTMDALLTPRHVAQTIGDKGGDYVMSVKANQPQVRADLALGLTRPPRGDRQATAQTVALGHGRIEQRPLTTCAALVGDSDWPGLAQVCEVGRHVLFQKTGEERVEVVYGVTSLSPERATPGRVLALVRGQWQSETQAHGVRDVTVDEDRSPVRCGNSPQVRAAFRKTVMGLLRRAG